MGEKWTVRGGNSESEDFKSYRKRISGEYKTKDIQGKGGFWQGKIPEEMPLIQSSDKGTDLEMKRSIPLRYKGKKMCEEGRDLAGERGGTKNGYLWRARVVKEGVRRVEKV